MRQILSCYYLKISFSKLVKVLVLALKLFYGTRTRVHFSISVLVLKLFYGTRTRVHFSISVLVLKVFYGTRTRKLSTRLHHKYKHITHYSQIAVKISYSWTKPFLSYKQKFEILRSLVGKWPSKNKGTRDASVGRSSDKSSNLTHTQHIQINMKN